MVWGDPAYQRPQTPVKCYLEKIDQPAEDHRTQPGTYSN